MRFGAKLCHIESDRRNDNMKTRHIHLRMAIIRVSEIFSVLKYWSCLDSGANSSSLPLVAATKVWDGGLGMHSSRTGLITS